MGKKIKWCQCCKWSWIYKERLDEQPFCNKCDNEWGEGTKEEYRSRSRQRRSRPKKRESSVTIVSDNEEEDEDEEEIGKQEAKGQDDAQEAGDMLTKLLREGKQIAEAIKTVQDWKELKHQNNEKGDRLLSIEEQKELLGRIKDKRKKLDEASARYCKKKQAAEKAMQAMDKAAAVLVEAEQRWEHQEDLRAKSKAQDRRNEEEEVRFTEQELNGLTKEQRTHAEQKMQAFDDEKAQLDAKKKELYQQAEKQASIINDQIKQKKEEYKNQVVEWKKSNGIGDNPTKRHKAQPQHEQHDTEGEKPKTQNKKDEEGYTTGEETGNDGAAKEAAALADEAKKRARERNNLDATNDKDLEV